MSQEIARWADSAMYRSEPMPEGGPKVTLLNATPDPLGSLAALTGIYEGKVIRSLADVTDAARRDAFENMMRTELNGPLEVAQFHFLVEGVTRSFTHQMVRERQAFFAQESMRFAVVDGEDWNKRTAYPPSLAGSGPSVAELMDRPGQAMTDEERTHALKRDAWDEAIINAQDAYNYLIDAGVPAEDARGLMPHAMTTRLHWVLDLRSLLHVAGLRLCTQAQFEWRVVMAGVVKALRAHANRIEGLPEGWMIGGPDAWQFELIANALKPICYQRGRCGFMARFDRGCTIRERVEERAANGGTDSREWNKPFIYDKVEYLPSGLPTTKVRTIDPIRPEEWAADPTAARR